MPEKELFVTVIFSNNTSPSSGGGIYNYDYATLNYSNTIVANSTGGGCYNAGIIGINSNNLVEDNAPSPNNCGTPFLISDPNLGSLASNGGFTQTMALLAGSPAIDAGNDVICAAAPVSNLDQRGIARPQGLHCDIGAFESDQPPSTPTYTPTNTPTSTPTSTPGCHKRTERAG